MYMYKKQDILKDKSDIFWNKMIISPSQRLVQIRSYKFRDKSLIVHVFTSKIVFSTRTASVEKKIKNIYPLKCDD